MKSRRPTGGRVGCVLHCLYLWQRERVPFLVVVWVEFDLTVLPGVKVGACFGQNILELNICC